MQYDLIDLGGGSKIDINFPHPDDHKRWRRNLKILGKPWKYRKLLENPIEFKHNSMGYRTHEFDFDNDGEYIIHIGCSNTYGLYLHEHERASNLIEKNLNIKTYNLGLCSGSANYIMMNIANLLYNVSNKPKAVVIQWPKHMRLNFPYTHPSNAVMRIQPMASQKGFGPFIQGEINPIETHSKWCRQHTLNLLNSFDINAIEYDITSEENFYNISEIARIDYAYDNTHIGTLTNEHIFNYVKEQL
jgi:hypothetical protein